MQKSFIQHLFTVSILSCCLLFGGCSQNSAGDDTSSATTASTSPSETVTALPADVSPDSDTSAIESTSEDTRALTLSVVNMCGIEVGMVAVIDPVTGEQVNLDSLSDQESISMEADWPSSVNEFQWALYNTDGELCVEGTTDISSAQTTVTLLLTGDGDLEKSRALRVIFFPRSKKRHPPGKSQWMSFLLSFILRYLLHFLPEPSASSHCASCTFHIRLHRGSE